MNSEGLGNYLKKKREEKGLTLADIANETKVQKMYLEAIEEEKFDELPEPTYVRGFLKSYARAIKADKDEILELYRKAAGDHVLYENNKKNYETPDEDKKNPKKIFLFILVFILLIIGIGKITKKIFFSENKKNIEEKVQKENIPKIIKTEDGIYIENIDFKTIDIVGLDKTWVDIKDETNADNNYRGYIYPNQKINIKTKNKLIIESESGYNIKVILNGNDIGRLSDKKGEYVRKEY